MRDKGGGKERERERGRERQRPLFQGASLVSDGVQRLVGTFIVSNPLLKILHSLFRVKPHIVWTLQLHSLGGGGGGGGARGWKQGRSKGKVHRVQHNP